MKKIIVFLVLITAISSCKNKTERVNKLVQANWLIGRWENNSEQGNLLETWEKQNDSVYLGHSYFIKGKDTLHFESVELKQKGENVYYIPVVRGQNDGKPVEFKMTASSPKQMTFQNLKHDYPQKIVYSQITVDSLVATVSGIQEGKQSIELYPMKKNKLHLL